MRAVPLIFPGDLDGTHLTPQLLFVLYLKKKKKRPSILVVLMSGNEDKVIYKTTAASPLLRS